MFNKLFIYATGAVALIILFDIATGQGPPGLNSYLGPPPPIPPKGYLPGPPPQVVQGVAYLPRGEYDVKRLEKPLNGKDIYESDEKEEKYVAKSYDKEDNKDYEKDFKNTTPKPGVFSSFSNSMSDAWKSLTNLGRQKRNIPQTKTVQLRADLDTNSNIHLKTMV